MIIARRQKIGKNYSRYFYLYETVKEGMSSNKSLRSTVFGDDVSGEPNDVFEVRLDNENAYIIDKNSVKIDVGYTSKDLRIFFYCQIL